MKKKVNKFFLYIPLILVEVYLIATLLLYEFGPIEWATENETMFWTLIVLYHLAFIVGYALSVHKVKLGEKAWIFENVNPKIYRWAVWGVIVLCMVCACIEYKNVTYASSYIPLDLPRNFLVGLLNPAERYYSKGSGEFTPNKIVTVFSALFSFIYTSIIPLLVVEWKRLSVPQRICLMFIIVFKVMVYVSIGTNKGIFDTFFAFASILIILLLLNAFHRTDEHIDKKTFAIIAAFVIFLALFSVSYFTVNISDRLGIELPDKLISFSKPTEAPTEPPAETPIETPTETPTEAPTEVPTETPTEAPTEAPAESVPPAPPPPQDSFVERAFRYGTDYLTQGYYGMSLALDEEFTSTYGIGNSRFLTSNFQSLFGINVRERTYQHKITDLWHEDIKWHSFYSYMANDVSFYGVIAIMFLLGLFYGMICKDVILNNSLIGKMILPLFVIMFMYMPANNQVFTNMATCTAFFELSFLWLVSKISWKKGLTHGK